MRTGTSITPALSRILDDATPKIASSLLIHTARAASQLLRKATSPSKVSACTLPFSSLSVVWGQIAQLVSAEGRCRAGPRPRRA